MANPIGLTEEGRSVSFKVYEMLVETEDDLRVLTIHLPDFKENIELAHRKMRVLILSDPKNS